jgi:hypothetical protein
LVIINLILIINTFFKYSPPRDIKKSQPEGSMLVLDIAGPAPLPTKDGFGTGNTSSSNAELGAWQLCNAQFIQLKMKRDKKFLF